MNHFIQQTWKLQGPDFANNVWSNMMLGRFRKETMWQAMPNIDTDTVVVVGAGPSLVRNINEMKNIPKEWPIVVTDRAYRQVHEAGIKPYAVTNLEATIETLPDIQKWWDGLPKDIPLTTVSHADPCIQDLWGPGGVYWLNTYNQENALMRYARKIEWLTGSKPLLFGTNVGVTSIILAVNLLTADGLNVKSKKRPMDVVLLGYDHFYYKDNMQVNFNVNDINGKDGYLPWNFFIGQFETKVIAGVSKGMDVHIWNCSDGGIAYGGDIHRSSIEEYLADRARVQEVKT